MMYLPKMGIMVAKLVAEEGILKGLVLNLEEGDEWIIGRDPDECQLLVEDPAASRRHALCRNTSLGIQVENLSSTNPLEVNEEPISEPTVLHHGDALKIGSGVFRFYSETSATVDSLPQTEEEPKNQMMKENMKEEKNDSIFEEKVAVEEEHLLADVDLNLAETTGWLLKVVAGPNNGAEFRMEPDTSYILGTDPASCDIVFQDVSVSRQHARLTIRANESLSIEDLKSRNGTLVEGEKVEGQRSFNPNTIVSLGTSSFIVYNLEGERDTVISPLLPAIVKVLQESEKKKGEEEKERKETEDAVEKASIPLTLEESKPKGIFSKTLLVLLVAGIALLGTVGISTLFKSEEVIPPLRNPIQEIELVLQPYPDLKYSYFKETGRLFLTGHVLTPADKNRLIYNLNPNIMPFIKEIDDRIVVDENIWNETNQVLAKNPSWRGIAIHSPSAGHFVISGYLENKKQAEALSDYLTQNFPYPDLLEKRIFVDEEVASQIQMMLFERGFQDVMAKVYNGEATLEGAIPIGNKEALQFLVTDIEEIEGIRRVRNFIVELPVEESVVNVSDKYHITGSLTQGRNISVVIQGRILTVGDLLDGMKITEITPNRVYLEKNDTQYIIEYNR